MRGSYLGPPPASMLFRPTGISAVIIRFRIEAVRDRHAGAMRGTIIWSEAGGPLYQCSQFSTLSFTYLSVAALSSLKASTAGAIASSPIELRRRSRSPAHSSSSRRRNSVTPEGLLGDLDVLPTTVLAVYVLTQEGSSLKSRCFSNRIVF